MIPLTHLVERGALFVANHSGGKDSQAMLIDLAERIPAKQLLTIHASLGDVEWPGALELAQQQAADVGCDFIVAKARKTLLEMVERRYATRPEVPSWLSSANRQCTSDLKRDPITRETKAYAKAHGFSIIVNCEGIRAAESVARSKRKPWSINGREHGKAGREWYVWYPIFEKSTRDVFSLIDAAGQEPHWAYAAGNERLSCVFCIMSSKRDLANGAKHRPDLLARYLELEKRTGYTMHMSRKPLLQLIAEAQDLAEAA
jgi:3'-phosphoadenosine 5'-phosphosulfate sulfotransferase (PAPS reductase)/FAD synthetase